MSGKGTTLKGITVEIGGDTTKLSKALESVNKSIKGTQSGLKDVNKLLKLDPSCLRKSRISSPSRSPALRTSLRC